MDHLGWFASALVAALVAAIVACIFPLWGILNKYSSPVKGTVAFFHPFADGGGGGERVLWCAVKAVQDAAPWAKVIIYAREGPTAEQLAADARERFNIELDKPIQVVPLALTSLILPQRYPRFTLLGQAVGSVRLGHEALGKMVPEVFIDTTGWAFTYPLVRLAGSRVVAYVHYPTISTDMITRVKDRQATYNNDEAVAGSLLRSLAKLVYYRLVAAVYGAAGGCAHVTLTNSSWTQRHIEQLWWSGYCWFTVWGLLGRCRGGGGAGAAGGGAPLRVYPPCDTTELQKLPLDRRLKQLFLVSVAQFRPEKNHRLQLEAFAAAKDSTGHDGLASQALRVARLKMVGSCRNDDDRQRLAALQEYAQELGVAGDVDWCVNVPFSELKSLLGGAVGGLHTMVDEHFGISVVEYMAAGVIPIAHNSGGPRADIVRPEVDEATGVEQITGYLATSVDEYADAVTRVLVMDQRDRLKISAAAQRRASLFSTERFLDDFTAAVAEVLPAQQAA